MTRPNATSPITSPASCPGRVVGTSYRLTSCQAVVDSAHQVIVAARATNQSSDKQQAAAMMQETIDNVGAVPREVSADAGYYSAKAVDELSALGVDPFVAPEQTRHGSWFRRRSRGRIPKVSQVLRQGSRDSRRSRLMRRWMRSSASCSSTSRKVARASPWPAAVKRATDWAPMVGSLIGRTTADAFLHHAGSVMRTPPPQPG